MPESLLPQNVGVAIATDGSITIPFSSPMDAESVEAALQVLPEQRVELDWSDDAKLLTVSPERRWRSDERYLLILGQSAATQDGTSVGVGRRFSFTTAAAPAVAEFQVRLAGADVVAPEAVGAAAEPSIRTLSLEAAERPVIEPGSHVPTQTARDVSSATTISIRFSTEMDRADVEDHFTITPSVDGKVTWNGDELLFAPSERLVPGGRYTVSLIGAHDAEGNVLGGKANFSFLVTPGAQLTRTDPASDATDVEPTSVEMWFSSPMDVEATNDAFALTDTTTGTVVGGHLVWNDAGTQLTYTPDRPFERGRTFAVTIGDAARDADGNAFSTTWSFTTPAAVAEAPAADVSRAETSTRSAPQMPAVAPASSLVGYALNQINAARAAYGFAPLVLDSAMTAVATAHAIDQVTNGYYSHTSLNGMSLYQRLAAGGVAFSAASENQCHYYGQTAEATLNWCHSAFMAEPYPGHWNHIANILNPRWTRVGVGVGDNGSHVVITWDFAN